MVEKTSPAELLGAAWCRLAHDSVMWPIHGEYECRTCGRHYAVPWDGAGPLAASVAQPAPARAPQPPQTASRRSWGRFAWLLIPAIAVILASSAKAAESNTANVANAVFERYLALQAAGGEQPWSVETIDVEAWLPRLSEHGRLRAIRSLAPEGSPQYQKVEITGDRTVRQQVLLRYLRAEFENGAQPNPATAITPANYKIAFRGQVAEGGFPAYAFKITPRQKREGLIKGELWLDADTATVIHQSGYLVKRPSFFIKRVAVTREYWMNRGVVEARTTRVHIDTRIAGPADLLIEERPISSEESLR